MATVRLPIGSMWVEINAESPQGLVQKAAFWSEVASKCVGRKDLGMFCRTVEGNSYFGIVDYSDGAELCFHQYRDAGAGFYVTRTDEFKVYKRRDAASQPDAPDGSDQGDPGNPDPDSMPEPERPPARASAPASRDYTMRGPAPARQPSQAPPRPPQTAGTQTGNQRWR